ncbi:MAG TPA: glycosyltransferase family 9 protein [Opitutaceae bacterium]|jgi:ADP-heptose:LPS heptosyltransferase
MSRPLSSQPRLLLWIDRYAGVPCCWLFTWLRRLTGGLRFSENVQPVRRILFVKLAEQGSTVLAHDALAEAVRRVGRSNVYFAAFKENRFILDILAVLPRENVLTVDSTSPITLIHTGWQMLGRARGLRFDAVIDMEFFARFSALLSYLIGARERVGFHTYFGEGPYRGDLLTHRVLYNPHLHTSETFLSLVHALDVPPAAFPTFDFRAPPPLPLPSFKPEPGEVGPVREVIRSLAGPNEGPVVLLNANCSDMLPLRRWSDDNYVALARLLVASDPDLIVGFTGSPDEAPRVNQLIAAVGSPRAVSFAGRTSLRELLVLYGLAELLITNDSGPAHFAALTSIDVISLFGPETPLLFAAHGPRSHPLWANIACSPCVNAFNSRQSACRNNVCMQRLSVERVFTKAAEILVARERTPKAIPVAERASAT